MGDRGGQLPHRRDAISVRELHLRLTISALTLAELFFRPLARGDVLDNAEHAARLPRLVPHHIALTVDDAHLAIGWQHPVLHVVPRTATQRLRYRSDDLLSIFRVNEFLISRSGYLVIPLRQPEDA